LSTFILGIGIFAAAAYAILLVGSGVGYSTGSSCVFDMGIACKDFFLASNSTNTVFAILGSNTQEFPITDVSMNAGLNGKPTDLMCSPGQINPGQQFICFATLNTFQKSGTYGGGNLTAHVGYCGFNGGDCGSAVSESFIGKYNSYTDTFNKPNIGMALTPPTQVGTQYLMNASFNLFGVSLFLSTIALSQNSCNPIQTSVIGPSSSSLSVAVNGLAACCAGMVNATYLGRSAIAVVPLNTIAYGGSNYNPGGNGSQGCVSLSPSTSKVTTNAQNNIAGVFANPSVQITVSDSGSNDNDALFNSNAILNIGGNYNNITMVNSNVIVTITGTYNQARFINSHVASLTISNNNNLVIMQNTTVTTESITGTNDIIQSS